MSVRLRGTLLQAGLAALLLAGPVWVVVRFFHGLPVAGTSLGLDLMWYTVQGWDLLYEVDQGLRNPPWSLLPVLPLAALFPHERTGWALIALATLGTLATGVFLARGRRAWRLVPVVLACTNFTTLRVIADGNWEVLALAGGLLVVWALPRQRVGALAVGLLLVTSKPQLAVMLVGAVGVALLRTWPVRRWLALGALLSAVVLPTLLWRGPQWLAALVGTWQRGSEMDISLAATLARVGVGWAWLAVALPVIALSAWAVWRAEGRISTSLAGALLAAGLLVAPYAAGNSVFTVLGVGVFPLIVTRPRVGLALVALTFAGFATLPFPAWTFAYSSTLWTAYTLLLWAVLLGVSMRAAPYPLSPMARSSMAAVDMAGTSARTASRNT